MRKYLSQFFTQAPLSNLIQIIIKFIKYQITQKTFFIQMVWVSASKPAKNQHINLQISTSILHITCANTAYKEYWFFKLLLSFKNEYTYTWNFEKYQHKVHLSWIFCVIVLGTENNYSTKLWIKNEMTLE